MARARTKTAPARSVALLRGINVGGNKKVPMAELRALAEELGWRDVATYIQSGNVVFAADRPLSSLEAEIERAIEKHFGFAVPVVVRSGAEWLAWAAKSPFRDAETARPDLLHIGLSKSPPKADAVAALAAYCKNGECVVVRDGAIWIDFPEGVARSKVTPAVLDRLVGSSVTLRNWRTVQELAAMVRAAT